MLTRRHLLTGGLALLAGAFTGMDAGAAPREIDKRCYVVWAYGSGENWWPTTNFAIYATPGEAAILRTRPGRIRVRVPYWDMDDRVGFIFAGSSDTGFNGDGYSFSRGPFSVFVPGPRKVDISLRLTMAHTRRTGRVLHFEGDGAPSQWILLHREG